MKVVFSRKGFDSAAGGAPSPIVDGRPVSLPIPATQSSRTTYEDLGLGRLVTNATKGKIRPTNLCHHDPMFVSGECWFGQVGSAQTHLANQGVGVGDVFLFFGLFAGEGSQDRHHRFFGYLKVEAVHDLSSADAGVLERLSSLDHPHVLGMSHANNTVYQGEGGTALNADDSLRLTRKGSPVSRWKAPDWLRGCGLTYHQQQWRWAGEESLEAAARGQEFVSDISASPEAQEWVAMTIARMRS